MIKRLNSKDTKFLARLLGTPSRYTDRGWINRYLSLQTGIAL